MTEDQADLAHLADIAVPPPVPWWPLAPGWWILGVALLATVAILGRMAHLHYRRNAYRRAALAELAAIGPIADPAGAAAASAILKRAALAAYPRSAVASLTGSAWLAFLDRTASTSDFTHGPAVALTRAVFIARLGDGAAILDASRRWVSRHRRRA